MSIDSSVTSRQIFVQRYSKGEARRLIAHLTRLKKTLIDLINEHYDKPNIKTLIKKVKQATKQEIEALMDDLTESSLSLAVVEAAFLVKVIQIASNAPISPLTNKQVESLVLSKKMRLQAGKVAFKSTIQHLMTDFSRAQSRNILNIITAGEINGTPSKEVAARLGQMIGTKSAAQTDALIRTINNHVTATARAGLYRKNKHMFSGERYTAKLDSSTTIGCASLDGTIFKVGKGVFPPRHWGCRSARAPILKEQYQTDQTREDERKLLSKQTYGEWLADRSDKVQNEILGINRAELFRSGKISIEQFTDKTGKVYTLKQLERLNPLLF